MKYAGIITVHIRVNNSLLFSSPRLILSSYDKVEGDMSAKSTRTLSCRWSWVGWLFKTILGYSRDRKKTSCIFVKIVVVMLYCDIFLK